MLDFFMRALWVVHPRAVIYFPASFVQVMEPHLPRLRLQAKRFIEDLSYTSLCAANDRVLITVYELQH